MLSLKRTRSLFISHALSISASATIVFLLVIHYLKIRSGTSFIPFHSLLEIIDYSYRIFSECHDKTGGSFVEIAARAIHVQPLYHADKFISFLFGSLLSYLRFFSVSFFYYINTLIFTAFTFLSARLIKCRHKYVAYYAAPFIWCSPFLINMLFRAQNHFFAAFALFGAALIMHYCKRTRVNSSIAGFLIGFSICSHRIMILYSSIYLIYILITHFKSRNFYKHIFAPIFFFYAAALGYHFLIYFSRGFIEPELSIHAVSNPDLIRIIRGITKAIFSITGYAPLIAIFPGLFFIVQKKIRISTNSFLLVTGTLTFCSIIFLTVAGYALDIHIMYLSPLAPFILHSALQVTCYLPQFIRLAAPVFRMYAISVFLLNPINFSEPVEFFNELFPFHNMIRFTNTLPDMLWQMKSGCPMVVDPRDELVEYHLNRLNGLDSYLYIFNPERHMLTALGETNTLLSHRRFKTFNRKDTKIRTAIVCLEAKDDILPVKQDLRGILNSLLLDRQVDRALLSNILPLANRIDYIPTNQLLAKKRFAVIITIPFSKELGDLLEQHNRMSSEKKDLHIITIE